MGIIYVIAITTCQTPSLPHLTESEADVTVFCGACPKGMGFWLPDEDVGFYCATPAQTLPLIYYVEALCVLAALKHCCVFMSPHQKLLIYTDNTNVVDIFSSLCCRPEFNTIIKHAVSSHVKSQIDVRVLHIPGDMNGVADAISCAEFDHAKTLAASSLLSTPSLSILDFSPPLPTNKSNLASPPHTSLGASEK